MLTYHDVLAFSEAAPYNCEKDILICSNRKMFLHLLLHIRVRTVFLQNILSISNITCFCLQDNFYLLKTLPRPLQKLINLFLISSPVLDEMISGF